MITLIWKSTHPFLILSLRKVGNLNKNYFESLIIIINNGKFNNTWKQNTWTIFWFQEVPSKTLSAVFSLLPEKNGLSRRISHRIYYLLMGCSWTVEASVEAGRTRQLLMIPGHTSSCTVGVAAAAVACCWWVFWTVPCAAPATRGFHRKELFCFLSQAFGQWTERETQRERERERLGISELSTRKRFLGISIRLGGPPETHTTSTWPSGQDFFQDSKSDLQTLTGDTM